MKKRFLITGASGFIGANLVRFLVEKNENVSIITRNKDLIWRLKSISSRLNIYEIDVLNSNLTSVIKEIKPDYIFHLAAYGISSNQKDEDLMDRINIKGTKNLLGSLRNIPFKLFINTGTFFEYGEHPTKIKETDELNPINHYAKTKVCATLYVKEEVSRNNLPLVTLRLFSPFGYFEDKNRLIPSIILSALKNEPIKISAPNVVRDFIFIEDVVDAYINATKVKINPGEIINIGSGNQHTIKETVDLILKITGSKSKVEWGKVEPRFKEPEGWEANISKAKRILKWEQKYTFEEGLRKTIDWFRGNLNLYE